MAVTQVCKGCQGSFEAASRRFRYCAVCRKGDIERTRLRARAWRSERERPQLVCEFCGAPFFSYRSDAKWCPSCRQRKRAEIYAHLEGRKYRVCSGCGGRKYFSANRCTACVRKERAERLRASRSLERRANEERSTQCQGCGQSFLSRRPDVAKWCASCLVVRRREIGRGSEQRTKYGPCPACGGRKHIKAQRCRSCEETRKASTQRGEHSPLWKGGRTLDGQGYIHVRVTLPNGKRAYRQEHRLVWEAAHGSIPAGHVLHHVNGDKTDNRIENLMMMTSSHHYRLHHLNDEVEMYQTRIRDLEAQVRDLEAQVNQGGQKWDSTPAT